MAGESTDSQMHVNTFYNASAVYDELYFETRDSNSIGLSIDVDDTVTHGGRGADYLSPRNDPKIEVQGQTHTGMIKRSHFIIGICILLVLVTVMITVGSFLAYNNAKDWKASEQDTISDKVGGWSAWSSWDTCSASCGIGEKQRRRECDSSLPSSSCDGESTESQLCFSTPCPGIASAFSVDWPLSIENNYLTFNTIIYSIGDDFNKETGKFNCTKPGVYVFSFSLVKLDHVSSAECTLAKNDGYIILGKVNSLGIKYASHTVVNHVNAGDTIGLMNCSPSTMEYVTNFSGFLLYPDY